MIAILIIGMFPGCAPRDERSVTIYTSQDKIYAEKILQEFTRETGIKANAVYDSEAVKTVGLANRLIAEKNLPQCDVFWNNEELRTRQLEREGVFGPTPQWRSFGYRSRQIVYNTARSKSSEVPTSLIDLTNAAWKGKIALAYPLFGTTATHFLSLRQHWGEATWEQWCRALMANQPFVVDGNSVVVKLVGSGEALIGLTDSDDISAFQREGLPVAGVIPRETFYIRNTVALVRPDPTPEAIALFNYLGREDVVQKLAAVGAVEGVTPPQGGITPKDWPMLLRDLDPATTVMKSIFLRNRTASVRSSPRSDFGAPASWSAPVLWRSSLRGCNGHSHRSTKEEAAPWT